MPEEVRLQKLLDFSVKILNKDNKPVGSGIVVSTQGQILTCAHVLRAAGIEPRKAKRKTIDVYFPQVRGGEEKKRKAKVKAFLPKHEDDIVVLELADGQSPLAPEQVAQLGTSEGSEQHDFRSYGFSSIGSYLARYAEGKIMGPTEVAEKKLLAQPIELRTRDIRPGLSGSGVLDVQKNLIVGLVTERWNPSGESEDDNMGWATDTAVLTFSPFDFDLHTQPYPRREAPQPKTDEQTKQQVVQVAQATVEQRTIEEKYSWNNAPAVLREWTGRDDLLKQITSDWNNPQKHVTGLIGFGGEGKSSLTRKWVDNLLNDGSQPQPDGVFWWGFYENRSVDEFLEAALKYMSGGRIDPRAVPSSNLRAQIIGAMINAGRYLFVLDGLEVIQHQEGDQYGLLQTNDLRDLLTFFASPDNQSFCLITSRAPLLDLMEYTTYTHRDVDRLSEDDGHALLRRLGVNGSDAELNKVVADWDGHALTLSILAAYLAERYKGDIKHLADIPVPTADEPRYERVHRVLRRYDEHLSENEREFLRLFSVFRLPVQESAFEKVFEPLLGVRSTRQGKPDSVLSKLFKRKKTTDSIGGSLLQDVVNRLVKYRLIRHDEHEKAYTTHPLIRSHYFALFTKGDPSQEKAAHEQIKDYYLSIAGDIPQYPTLDDLKPLIEVVHHACQAGAYDEAGIVHYDRIEKGASFVLMHQLGAYETDLNICVEYFPNNDVSQEPLLNSDSNKRWILGMMGFCLMILGRLSEIVQIWERHNAICTRTEDWRNASTGYRNLADLHAHLGVLEASAEAAHQALDLARRAEDKQGEMTSLSFQGTAYHLLGKVDEAKLTFQESEQVEKAMQHGTQYLFSYAGVRHADHLRRIGDLLYARRVTEANFHICKQNHWPDNMSRCHRILGDLDTDVGDHASAQAHYGSALKIARAISHRQTLIEALLAHGTWQAMYMKDANVALSDLNEALGYCIESGYRIHEANVRVALGWAYLANGEKDKAKQSAERALQMSNEMGYYWGKVDAEEVLKVIGG
ncbi:MAG TPA: trypsin-like peptidase domain-containing protein [Anaerolineales bacterium]|nr:trypsin-like peptidase domain-containing protein [Anaerolineales bacterium]